jgi:hypothetical protein
VSARGCSRANTFTDFDAPPGTIVLPARAGRFPELASEVDCDARRWFGWFFGYPTCCVEAFIERWERHGITAAHRPEPRHPVSRHALCDACARGPLAPLRPRLAERYCTMSYRAPRARRDPRQLALFVARDDEVDVWIGAGTRQSERWGEP